MPSTSITTMLLRLLAVAAVTAALCPTAHASSDATASPPCVTAWMPDVRERVAGLRARTQQAAAEARERNSRDRQRGQWWRAVAARPAQVASR